MKALTILTVEPRRRVIITGVPQTDHRKASIMFVMTYRHLCNWRLCQLRAFL